MSPYKIKIGR